MQLRKHIDSLWYRGKGVSVSKSEVTCTLDQQRPYDLARAYERAPYVELENLECDQDWATFVARWGPLWISDAERIKGRSWMRLDCCWYFQRRFTAFAKLLDSFGKPKQRDRLRDYLERSDEEANGRGLGITTPRVIIGLVLSHDALAQRLFQQAKGADMSSDPLQSAWLEQADDAAVSSAVAEVIQKTFVAAMPSFSISTEHKRQVITAQLGLDNLETALEWMVWNSYWMKKPQMFCQECQRAFRPESAHPRKYCTSECAHRATDRAWRRKKRAREKKGE